MENMQDNLQHAQEAVSEGMENVKDKLKEDYHNAGDKVSEAILTAKEKLPNVTPTPPSLKAQSSPNDLKARLEWGEPALTILDVRDRDTYNDGHIMGAMAMPMDELVDRAKPALALNRDIYVYAESDEETAQAASQLRDAGFYNVAELKGGFPAWKAIGGPTEGIVESQTPPDASDYNVVSHLASEKKMRQ